MQTAQNTSKKIKSIFARRQTLAHRKAQKVIELARNNPKFNANYLQINELNYLIAKKKYDKISHCSENTTLKKLLAERDAILKELNLTADMLEPQYKCKKCKDTGKYRGKYCNCYKSELTKHILQQNGVNYSKLKTFEQFNSKVFKSEEHQIALEKLKKVSLDFVKGFNATKINNIFLCGSTGVGKTFIAECIASELIKKSYYVNIVTAFQMNSIFVNYHGSFNKDKSDILSPLLEPDLLVIDDLGTEPVFNNVTKEYFYVIISERIINNKKTIITSNMITVDLINRYGERVYSRLFNKANSLNLSFTGVDLRTKI